MTDLLRKHMFEVFVLNLSKWFKKSCPYSPLHPKKTLSQMLSHSLVWFSLLLGHATVMYCMSISHLKGQNVSFNMMICR